MSCELWLFLTLPLLELEIFELMLFTGTIYTLETTKTEPHYEIKTEVGVIWKVPWGICSCVDWELGCVALCHSLCGLSARAHSPSEAVDSGTNLNPADTETTRQI